MRQDRAEPEPSESAPKQPSGRRHQTRMKVAFVIGVLVVLGGIAAALGLTRGGGSGAAPAPAASKPVSANSPVSASSTSPLELSGTDPVTGKAVSLSSFAGKPIVLNMWASWCAGCYVEARALRNFERAHPEAQVVGVDITDTKSGAIDFVRHFNLHHPNIFDPDAKVAARFGLSGLPATVFLDHRHLVVAKIIGATDLAGLNQGLKTAEQS